MTMRRPKRAEKADLLGDRALVGRQLLGGDGEEDQIVDAKHDFEDGQCQKAHPAFDREQPVRTSGPLLLPEILK